MKSCLLTFVRLQVGVNYFNSKCDDNAMFCTKHRLPFEHGSFVWHQLRNILTRSCGSCGFAACKFDHKKAQAAKVAAANPRVAGEKLEKI